MVNVRSLEGERWDQLAARLYGTSNDTLVNALRAANREVIKASPAFTLPAGALINVPVMASGATETVEIAPWLNPDLSNL